MMAAVIKEADGATTAAAAAIHRLHQTAAAATNGNFYADFKGKEDLSYGMLRRMRK